MTTTRPVSLFPWSTQTTLWFFHQTLVEKLQTSQIEMNSNIFFFTYHVSLKPSYYELH